MTNQTDQQAALEKLRNAERLFLDRQKERMQGKQRSHQDVEKELAYWDAVHSKERATAQMTAQPLPSQEMEYSEAKNRFNSILMARAQMIRVQSRNENFKWLFSSEQKQMLTDMLHYFINSTESRYDLSKGLYVFGMPGTGKTEIMRSFSLFTQNAQLHKAFEFNSMSDVYTGAIKDQQTDWVQQMSQGFRAFDELGRYTGDVLNFGNPININEAIIEKRYVKYQYSGQLTHLISNATPSEALEMFTPALADRIRSMTQGIHFSGTSKR